jgi:hypothetical protein
MIQNLINCLAAYKSRMEYQAIAFDVDRAAQYKELRKEMAKLYEIEDETFQCQVILPWYCDVDCMHNCMAH